GGTLYFLLSGNSPFHDGTVAQKLIWHQVRRPKPIRTLRPEVPEGLAAVLEKMMAKDAADRYQTPVEVAEALAPWTATPIPPPPENELPPLLPMNLASPGPDSTLGEPRSPSLSKPSGQTPARPSSPTSPLVRPPSTVETTHARAEETPPSRR